MRPFNVTAVLILIAWMFTSCEKQSASPAYNEEPVIEGYLFANNIASVKITSQIAVSSATSGAGEGIDTLQVFIDMDSSTHQLINIGDGVYEDTTLIIQEGKQYRLHFEYRGKTVIATTTVPALPQNFTESDTSMTLSKVSSTPTPGSFEQVDPVDLTWDNPDQSYFMVVVKNMENSPELIRDTTSARFRVNNFRSTPSMTSSYEIREMQFQYFGRHTITLYHLNPDYATLYDNNSSSSQDLSNPSTNITNGYGIFTGISTDTLSFEVYKK